MVIFFIKTRLDIPQYSAVSCLMASRRLQLVFARVTVIIVSAKKDTCAYSLTRSLTHSFTQSLTHSLTHSLILVVPAVAKIAFTAAIRTDTLN